MKLTVIAVTWWHSITDNDFLWDLLSSHCWEHPWTHRHFHSKIQWQLVEREVSIQSCTMRSQVICIHWITRINSLTVHEWSVFLSWSDSPARLTIDISTRVPAGTWAPEAISTSSWDRWKQDKLQAGYEGLNSADFQKDDVKDSGVLEALIKLHHSRCFS